MADTNINPPSPPNVNVEKDIQKLIQKLECPFTWNMDDITKDDNVEYHLNDDEELFPLLQLMRQVMTVYVDTKSKTESDEILKGLEKCYDIMSTINDNDQSEISADVVYYILQSTKCFVFMELNLQDDLERVFSKLKEDWQMNNKERSTLKACRSICWSKYHRRGVSEAEFFIREAIKENPNCEIWHFILGKNLRRKRRDSTIKEMPKGEEVRSFTKAYEMSANPVFGVFLAQMYREMRRTKDACLIYNKIYEQEPASTTILLRLALGFIRLKGYDKAKNCLDKVEAVSPNLSMYLHYRGIYHLNRKNYEEAAKFLKEASKDYNIPAEKQYLECAVVLDKTFDVFQYLHNMLKKYSHLPKAQTQTLMLDLALAYWLKRYDVPKAIKYFNMAVNVNPEATCITNYFSTQVIPVKEKNIYKMLNREVLPIVHRNREKFEQSSIDETDDLQRHCANYFANSYARTLNSFSKFKIKN